MIPIFETTPHGGTGYHYEEFRDRFLSICEEHQQDGRALAFAFLLFDSDSPELHKLLADSDYWRALDHLSGRYLSVFTFVGPPQFPSQLSPPFSTGGLRLTAGYMTAVNVDNDPGARLRALLYRYFGTSDQIAFPSVLFFQVEGDDVSRTALAQLTAEGVEPAFSELRALLREVVDALGKSGKEGHTSRDAAFDAVVARLAKRKRIRLLSATGKIAKNVIELAGAIKGFVKPS